MGKDRGGSPEEQGMGRDKERREGVGVLKRREVREIGRIKAFPAGLGVKNG